MRLLFAAIFACVSIGLFAQFEGIKYEDYTYSSDIKSVKFTRQYSPLSMPIVSLNSNDPLFLRFDEMADGYSNFAYKIIHCDRNWNPSDLLEVEFIDGFNGEYIEEYVPSMPSSYAEYFHYELILPNEDIKWIISGNFLLIVYDDDTNELILTRRFVVTENVVKIEAELTKPVDVFNLRTHHALQLGINYEDFNINRPIEEVSVSVLQNSNWQNEISGLKGNFANNGMLSFNSFERATFPALKEFRSFDTRSLQYRDQFVHSIDRNPDGTDVLLELGEKRGNRNYLFENDANGSFFLDNEDFPEPEISSEYANVIFTLEAGHDYFGKDIYIIGALTDWQIYEEFKLQYDEFRNIYACEVPLKQGYYDYMYGIKEKDYVDLATVEGSWFETENEYTILVYYNPMGGNYDRVIGYRRISSRPSNQD